MWNIWSYTRERVKGNEKRPNEDSSYAKGVEILLREIAKRVCPDLEEMDDPMVALQDHDIRQFVPGAPEQGSGCCQQTCHGTSLFLLLFREMPFKNYRGRSAEKQKTRDKLEEAKKQKTLKNSWVWNTSSSSSSSGWRDWSSD